MKRAQMIGCLVLHLALAASASAQEAAEPATYRPLIDRALGESRQSHWEEARALFRRAAEIYPNARAFRGLGMTSFELRDYTESVRALRASLSHEVQPLTAEQHAQAEGLLSQALLFVGSYSLEVPSGVTVMIDDRPVSREPDGTILLALGDHHVQARAEDGQSIRRAFDVRGGESGPLPLDFTGLHTEAPVRPMPEPTIALEPSLEPAATSENSNTAALALLISGGLVAVGGGVCLGLGLSDASSVANAPRATEWSDVSGAYERAPILTGVGGAALGVGVVMAGLGGVLLATGSTESVQVQVHAQGLSVRGVW